MEVFDPRTLTFTLLDEKLPERMAYMAVLQVRERITLVGGRFGAFVSNKINPGPVYEMDPQTGKWSDTGLKTPVPIGPHVGVVYNI